MSSLLASVYDERRETDVAERLGAARSARTAIAWRCWPAGLKQRLNARRAAVERPVQEMRTGSSSMATRIGLSKPNGL
jgi:hypothetical protein